MSAPVRLHPVRRLVTAVVLVAGLSVGPPVDAVPGATTASAAAAGASPRAAAEPGCRESRQRHARSQQRVRTLKAQLRRARAAGAQQRVRRLTARVRTAEKHRAELGRRARLACDRTPPQTRFIGGPADGTVVQGRSTMFRLGSPADDVAGYQCSLDGGAWQRCGYSAGGKDGFVFVSGTTTRSALRVRAVDRSGNVDPTPAVRRFANRWYTAFDVGGDRGCALRTNGSIRCWGAPFPGKQPPSGAYTSVDVGPGDHACATRASDGTLTCWGDNRYGQATLPAGTVRVYLGKDHTCTTTTCWGDDSQGEATVPADVTFIGGAGVDYTCGSTVAHTVRCWGDTTGGLADVPRGTTAFSAAGDRTACGFVPDDLGGEIVCWGRRLGRFETRLQAAYYDSIEVGGEHGCSYQQGPTCFGSDSFGQSDVPRQAPQFDPWGDPVGSGAYKTPRPGRNHTCAFRNADAAIVCWGDRRAGQTRVPAP